MNIHKLHLLMNTSTLSADDTWNAFSTLPAPAPPPHVNHTVPEDDLDDLLPQSMDFPLYGNVTANTVIKSVVKALDGGPNSVRSDAAVILAVATPVALLLCLGFMSKCRRVVCCGGACVCCWFNCTGACKQACGGESLLSGTEPHNGLEPDEEATDPDVILGDEEHDDEQMRDPPLPVHGGAPQPPSSPSEMSEEEEHHGSPTNSSYNRDCKQCCDTVAACLENGDGTGIEMNGGCKGPAIEAVATSKRNGKGRKK